MFRRFFTSDLHFGSTYLIDNKLRPFKSVVRMDNVLLNNINRICGKDDTLVNIGDFMQYWDDRGHEGLRIKPETIIKMIKPSFINVQGNHDLNNKVKSFCTYFRTTIGRFKNVSVSHYPSTNPRSYGTFRSGDLHLHGHIHNGEIFTIDRENQVLNVNLCCDLWNFTPVSEEELTKRIDQFMDSKIKQTNL